MRTRTILAATVLVVAVGCGNDSSTDQARPESTSSSAQTDPAVSALPATSPPTKVPESSTTVTVTAPTSTEDAAPLWPRPTAFHEAVYDAADDSVLIVGGCTGPQCSATQEVWSYDPHDSIWTELSRLDFMSPAGGPVAYDAESERIIALDIVFGDVEFGSIGTWVFDRATDTWTEMEADPQPRLGVGSRMVYDTQSDRVIAFGGQGFDRDGALVWTPGTWAYDYNTNTWTDMQPAVEPSGINYYAFSYDEESDRAVLFGLQDGGATLMLSYG